MVEINYESELQPESRAGILDGLVAFNRSQTPEFTGVLKNIGLTLTDPETGKVDGGLTGRIGFGRLFVELLFVPERLRGQGVGRQLMERAEAVAREYGCNGVWLDTFSFQAPDFYATLGYTIFGELADYPPGHRRYFLHKSLS
ncbi:GNAT family N-acetyltransferase [Pelagibacterium lentulum]|uniref:N-acetyltransferase n=1 Tax=Pelagibacterium lentulum TaxID=2029865 RepID=A0A916R8H5_9HYPH|nr:GNAT family N-acetyltransferase [Pelagibacterium lentulum]GGA36079.1 N-acetyltransferase [Pelagibacterium lentulum]